jgi:hypothetical protein
MAARHGQPLETAPRELPSGWAAPLSLYGIHERDAPVRAARLGRSVAATQAGKGEVSMNSEANRRRRLPLHYLRGTWRAEPLTYPGDFPTSGEWEGRIDLHMFTRAALEGLHSVFVVNLDPEWLETDQWHADLDITDEGQWVTFPFWSLDTYLAQAGERPSEAVEHPDDRTLVLTAWHAWDHVTPRRFRLTKLSDDLEKG